VEIFVENSHEILTQSIHLPGAIGIGFDFYGAGNVGDDLMISGFAEAISVLQADRDSKILATTNWDITSQVIRFPEIEWILRKDLVNQSGFDSTKIDCWAGVGDTPFQQTAGDWFLSFLLAELDTIKKFRQKVLISVGAEVEISSKAKEFSLVAQVFDRISTRDEHSYNIIVDMLGVPEDKVYCGSDLAHISLPKLISDANVHKYFELGLIIPSSSLSMHDMAAVKKFIVTRENPVSIIANDVRVDVFSEQDLLKKISRLPWSRVKNNTILQVPDYAKGTLYDLIQPVCACETIITARYHGLLTAAWAGCKVAAVGSNSKVSALATELDIPVCKIPINLNSLETLQKEARPVSRDKLNELTKKALEGVAFTLQVQ
jgi:polysaccharide pyruvyl transferase WcaK-like protein